MECSIQLQNKLLDVSLQNKKRQTGCNAQLGPIAAYEDQSLTNTFHTRIIVWGIVSREPTSLQNFHLSKIENV